MITEADLHRLLEGGEQFDVEFVGEREAPLGDVALVEAVVCLANARGGVLLVGVEDDGAVSGARPRHGSYTDPRRVEVLVGNLTVPSCPVQCAVLAVEGGEVLAVEVPPGRPVTCTVDGVYRRRALDLHGRPRCVPLLHHEIQSREASRGALDYTALVVPEARWEDLDPLEFERLRQTIARAPGRADAALATLSDVEIVKALGLGEGGERIERVKVAGILLLGRETAIRKFVPTHEAAFQVLSGTRIAVNDFFRGPLIRVADEIGARFDARNEEEEIAVGPLRVGMPKFSPAGFREAVHNALVHRDYTRLGAVHVQWRGTELEIGSPGGFVESVRLENLLVTVPTPRNPTLADAFKRIGLVERTGRGIDTIFEGQLRYGRRPPDWSHSNPGSVQVVLPGGAANVPVAQLILEHDQPSRRMTVDEMIVVNAIERDGEIDPARAAELTQRSESAAVAVLDRLADAGVLESRPERRTTVYEFADGVLKGAVAGAAGARRQADPAEREELVLQYVAANGRITRSQAAELCQVEGREARQVLERLVKRGALVVKGERRGSYYEMAGAGGAAPV